MERLVNHVATIRYARDSRRHRIDFCERLLFVWYNERHGKRGAFSVDILTIRHGGRIIEYHQSIKREYNLGFDGVKV